MWKIIPQTQKDSLVDAKVLKFCPVEDEKTNETRFMRIPPVVQVLIGFGDSDSHTKLKYSVKSGTWTMQLPDKWVRPTIKVGKRVVEDRLASPVKRAGEKRTFASSKVFFMKLADKVGADLASRIEGLFTNSIAQLG